MIRLQALPCRTQAVQEEEGRILLFGLDSAWAYISIILLHFYGYSNERRLIHLLLITFFAINNLRPVRSIRGFKFIRTRRIAVTMLYSVFVFPVKRILTVTLARTRPKMKWISLPSSFIVST